MVTTLKSGSDSKAIRSTLEKLQKEPPRKKLAAYRYCGVVGFREDALVLQKGWRDEWK